MSAVSDIYDALLSVVSTALPTHTELNNPYRPEEDSVLSYDAAYGLAYRDGANLLGNENSGVEQRQRIFEIVLTRRIFARKRDKTARSTAAKDLMEDWTLVLDSLAEQPRLNNPSLLQKVQYVSDDGIDFLTLDRERNGILILRTTIQVDYEQEVAAPNC